MVIWNDQIKNWFFILFLGKILTKKNSLLFQYFHPFYRSILMSPLAKYDSFFFSLLIISFILKIIFLISKIVAPVNKRSEKLTSYELGIESMGMLESNSRSIIICLLFIIFDVKAIFFYPWAMCFNELGSFVFIEAFILIFILIIGLTYTWQKGVLEWS
jgi:NADH-quinone oxidoreductase subunit A